MDQSFDSSNSIISSSSTITHCANLGTSNNVVSAASERAELYQINLLLLDHKEIFRQLYFARCGQPPYEKFQNWSDVNLWNAVPNEVHQLNRYKRKPTVNEILHIVRFYYQHYVEDPTLCKTNDITFKNGVRSVFGTLHDQKGRLTIEVLQGLQEQGQQSAVKSSCKEKTGQFDITLSFSGRNALLEKMKMRTEKKSVLPTDGLELKKFQDEMGYKGILALQFAKDLKSFNTEDRVWFIVNYGAISVEYITIANETPETRRKLLIQLLHDPKQSSSYSSLPTGSHKRKTRHGKEKGKSFSLFIS